MTTIRDVAERAQVSASTVSRVLNNHPSVNPVIRRFVQDVIEELQYEPNPIARTLRTAKTQTLGLLIGNLRNSEVAGEAIFGAEAAAREHGYGLLVADARRDKATEERNVRTLLERRVDGLLTNPTMPIGELHRMAQWAGVPTVLFGQPAVSSSLPTVVLSFSTATNEAIDHLIDLGHRRIATITHASELGLEPTVGWGARYIQRALRERSIEADGDYDWVVRSTFDCTQFVAERFTRGNRPTALFVTPLYLVPATLAGLRAARANVPRDVSVIGFGDSAWAQVIEPPLSVIAADIAAHLDAAARLLIRLINKEQDQLPSIEHHGLYIRRGSVAPPNDRGD